MNLKFLTDAGLTEIQAKTYTKLIEKGALTPPKLADILGESRTNMYMVLDKLESVALVERLEVKPIKYVANNPMALEDYLATKQKKIRETEQELKQAMPALLSYFYSFTEKPGVRLLQGLEGIKELHTDTLRAKEDIYLLRTQSDITNLSWEYIDKYRKKRAKLGIKTYGYTPETEVAKKLKSSGDDKKMLFFRKMLPLNAYTAPVEIDVYGDRTAFMIFGEEIMGVLVNSPQLAEGMRQVFKMIKTND